jgi:hypothetical protein
MSAEVESGMAADRQFSGLNQESKNQRRREFTQYSFLKSGKLSD